MRSLQPVPYASVLPRNLRAARAAANLSQADVGERMQALGFRAWLRSTVSLAEQGKRRVTAEELLGLALAFGTSMVRLAEPSDETPWVELPAGGVIHRGAVRGMGAIGWDGNKPIYMAEQARMGPADDGGPEDYFAPQLPVVAAIVTSRLGVLVGRRNDGKPLWTFIAGEQDAVKDENPADTAVREVKEETGLRIETGDVIGERVHPKTGRTMVYIAARPTRGTDVFVGDEEELAEVRWVSLAEADELLPGMFEPVREHLARELGEA
jgi:8-oxo-dGTP pyrophosphatase MutT (NUDIX family)/transcriptional regulator with XRE-family HTH domain